MTGTRILWGQMLGALAMVLLGCWAATEWTAWRLGFQPALGLPWVRSKRCGGDGAGFALTIGAGADAASMRFGW